MAVRICITNIPFASTDLRRVSEAAMSISHICQNSVNNNQLCKDTPMITMILLRIHDILFCQVFLRYSRGSK